MPDRTFLAERDGAGGWRTLDYAERRGEERRHRPGPDRARPRARPAGRDPLRQLDRFRPAPARLHARLGAGHAGLAGLLADVARLREAEGGDRAPRPLRRLRRQAGPVRRRAGGARPRRPDAAHLGRRRRQREPRRMGGDPGDRRARGPARRGRPRHGRQDPAHLGLDRAAQGGDQHPAHAVRQPGADDPRLPVPARTPARHLRLAAVEPHLRRQFLLQPDPVPRRHVLARRGQAGARPVREDARQSARGDADPLPQRAARLRRAGAGAGGRRGPARPPAGRPRRAVLRRRRAAPVAQGEARRALGRGARGADPDRHLARLDRDRAGRDLHDLGLRRLGQYRRAAAGRRGEARAQRRQAGGALPRPHDLARLLGLPRPHPRRRSTRTATSGSATR